MISFGIPSDLTIIIISSGSTRQSDPTELSVALSVLSGAVRDSIEVAVAKIPVLMGLSCVITVCVCFLT